MSQSEQAKINGQKEALDKTLSENQINAAEMEAAIKAMRADPRFSDSEEMQDGLAKMETAFGNMQKAGIPMNGGSLLEIAQGAKPILGKASVANAILSFTEIRSFFAEFTSPPIYLPGFSTLLSILSSFFCSSIICLLCN